MASDELRSRPSPHTPRALYQLHVRVVLSKSSVPSPPIPSTALTRYRVLRAEQVRQASALPQTTWQEAFPNRRVSRLPGKLVTPCNGLPDSSSSGPVPHDG